ncbi:hypothetical protein BGZ63DRAFT_468440 [Mariannaea sp. PMI_226]|nr:hypothetical protein BGZ63DRAFT_468440 [Mariannaea sp. PMI_226]
MDGANHSISRNLDPAPPIPPRSPDRLRLNSIRTSLRYDIDDLLYILSQDDELGNEDIESPSTLYPTQCERDRNPRLATLQDCSYSAFPGTGETHPVTAQTATPREEPSNPFLLYTQPEELSYIYKIRELHPSLCQHQPPRKVLADNTDYNCRDSSPFTSPISYDARLLTSLNTIHSQHNSELSTDSAHRTYSSRVAFDANVDFQSFQKPVPKRHNFQYQKNIRSATESYFDTSSTTSSKVNTPSLKDKLKWVHKPRNALRWLRNAFSLSEDEKAAFKARRSMGY